MALDELEHNLLLTLDTFPVRNADRLIRKLIREYLSTILPENKAGMALSLVYAHTDTRDVECIMSIVDYITRLVREE